MLRDYQDLIMGVLQDTYDKVECISEDMDEYKCYITPLDEIHMVTVNTVYTETEEIQGFELIGERLDIGHNWEICYIPTEKGLEKWGENNV